MIERINIEEMSSTIDSLGKVIPKLRIKGDVFYVIAMEKYFSESEYKLRRFSCLLSDFQDIQQFSNTLGFGGFFLHNREQLNSNTRIYGVTADDLLKKDVYFALLFLRYVFEGLNNEFKYNSFYTNYGNYYHLGYVIGNTYKLAKNISYKIHSIYGNCYDYGLSSYVDKLHNLAIKYKSDLRSPDQKMIDDVKNGDGCLGGRVHFIFILIGFFIFVAIITSIASLFK